MRSLLALFILLVGGVALSSSSLADCCLDMTIDVKVKEGAAGPMLKATIRNNGPTSVEVNKSLLPWGGRYSLILVAVREKSPNEPLAQRFFMDDIGPETVELERGGVLEGQIDMREFFQQLPSELKKDNLIVLWSYQLVAVNGKESKRQAGWVRVLRET